MKKTLPSPKTRKTGYQRWLFFFFASFLALANLSAQSSDNLYINIQGPTLANPGELLTYTISFANNGTALAQNVEVIHELPDPILYSFVSAEALTGGYSYVQVGNQLKWSIGTLGGGLRQLVVQLRAGLPGVGLQDPNSFYMPECNVEYFLTNSATITSPTYAGEEGTATLTTSVTQFAQALLAESLGSIIPGQGGTARNLISITNTGNITDNFSLSYIDVDCQLWDPPLENTNRELIGSFYDLDNNPVTETGFLLPNQQFLFFFNLATDGNPPNAQKYDCKEVFATSQVCDDYKVYTEVATMVNQLQRPYLDMNKLDNPDPVRSGEELTYIIFIYNSGGKGADNVIVTESFPEGVTFSSATPAPMPGINNVWSLGPLPSMQYMQINITVQVNAGLPNGTILENTVTALYYDGNTEYTQSASEQTTVRSTPDLLLTKSAEPLTVDPEGLITYTLYYENIGNAQATGVYIEDNFNEDYLDVYDAAGGDYITTDGVITWNLGTLLPGESGSIVYVLQAKELEYFNAGTTTITNTAAIYLIEADDNYQNNQDIAFVQVTVLPDLHITKIANPDPAQIGQTLEYTITFGNSGEVAHADYEYEVIDYLPEGTILLNAESLPLSGVYDETSHTITWTFGDPLNPGEQNNVDITIALSGIDCDILGEQLENKVTIYSKYYADPTEENNEFILVTNVIDNTPPEITCAVTETQTVDANLGATYVHSGTAWDATATDNCGDVDLSWALTGATIASGDDSLEGVTFNEGTTLVTWTATDGSGNTASCSFTVIVNAFADLEITKIASVMGTGDDAGKAIAIAGEELIYIITVTNHGPSQARNVVITDDVSAFWSNAQFATTDDPDYNWAAWTTPYEYAVGNLNVDATVTIYIRGTFAINQCEDITNIASVSSDNELASGTYPNTAALYTIVLDETNPVITCPTVDVSYNTDPGFCYASLTFEATATDNCGVDNIKYYVGAVEITFPYQFPVGTTTVRAEATDLSGNTDDCTFDVVVIDNQDPVITCPTPAASYNADAGECYAELSFTATATDNCGVDNIKYYVGAVEITFPYQFPVGTTTVRAEATDLSGNTDDCTFDVVVFDTQDPVITCPTPAASYNADAGECYAELSFTATATDNCGVDNIKYYVGAVEITFPYQFPVGTTTVRAEATDLSGNTDDCTFDVVVIDNQDPVITCPTPAASYNADAGQCYAELSFTATATDNCGVDNIKYYVGAVEITFPYQFPVGTTTVRAEATDLSGNTSDCTFAVVVLDNQPPVITTEASNLTVECDGLGNPDALSNWLASHGGALATDNCGEVTWSYLPNPAVISDLCGATGTVTVTFRATDVNGLYSETTATFTIVDTTDPVWVNEPTDLTVECDGDGNTAQLNAWLASFSGNDICGTATVTHDYVAANFVAECGATGYVDVEFTLTDACGNDISKTARFTIEDTTDPVWVNEPADLTVECDGDGNTAQLTAWLASFSGSDLCGTATVTHDYVADNFVALCGATGYVDVEFTLTDACGNDISKTARFTIEDTTDPVWVAEPADMTVECDGSGNTAELTAWLASFSGSDICGTATVTHDYVAANFVAACGATGYVDVEFTLTDACGNDISKTARFTIEDTTDPFWVVEPADMTVECDGSGNTAQLATWLDSFSGSDICGTAIVTHNFTALSDDCGATGSATVTFTLTDACGNFITKDATFTIEDTTPPAFVCPPSIVVINDEGEDFATVTIDIPVVMETCGSYTLVNDFTNTANASGQYPLGVTTITYTATDDCGLSYSCSFTVTVQDEEAPIITCPPTITVNCINEVPLPYANYAAFVAAGGLATDNNEIDESSFELVSETSDGLSCPETITRVYRIADDDGNFSECSQLIIVDDQLAPVFTIVPANLTVECDGLGNIDDLVAWLANVAATDNCSDPLITNNFSALTDDCGATGSVTVIWTATDDCGNFETTSATFTIVDTTNPVWVDEPADMTVECDGDGNTAELTAWLASFSGSDVCGTAVVTHDFDAENF
ncbi:MAG: HYR domain-containing protein, partial [Bacteroidales bacterium]|nr:HYR domain-containing protein [Bacteroidales bacterium]